jgi:hypothetical protein
MMIREITEQEWLEREASRYRFDPELERVLSLSSDAFSSLPTGQQERAKRYRELRAAHETIQRQKEGKTV